MLKAEVEGLECTSLRRGERKRVTGTSMGPEELLLFFSFLLPSASHFHLLENTVLYPLLI